MTDRPVLYVAIDEANDKITVLTAELENLKAAYEIEREMVKGLKERIVKLDAVSVAIRVLTMY